MIGERKEGGSQVNHSIFIPGQPVPQGRPRVTRSGHAYTPKRTRDYQSEMLSGLRGFDLPRFGKGVAVSASIHFFMRHRTKPRGSPHVARGDLDNLIKMWLDILQKAGVLYDDSQVCEIRASKSYCGDDPGVLIELSEFINQT